ncbi:MAG: hypothetical protein WEC79_07445 [Thermomicrobiales bacterium]
MTTLQDVPQLRYLIRWQHVAAMTGLFGGAILVVALGCVLAFIAGGVIGFAFRILDWALLEIPHARWRTGGRASEMDVSANDTSTDTQRAAS